MKSKKLTAILMCLVMLVTMFTACGKNDDTDKDDDKNKTEQESPDPTKEAEPTETPEPTPDPGEGNDSVFDYEKGIDVMTLDEGDAFDQFLNEVYISLITTDSFSLHFKCEDPEKYGIELDYTYGEPDSTETMKQFIETIEEGLDEFDYDSLSDSQKVIYDLLAYELDMYYQGEDFEDFYIWSLAQNNNLISNVQTLFTEYSIQSEQDAEDFIMLLSMLPDYLEEEMELIQDDIDDGACITEAMLDMSIEMAEDWLSDSAEENIIYVAFEINLEEAELSDEVEEQYLEQLAEVVENEMLPAINDYIDFLEALEEEIDDAKGLCSFEGGKEYYAWLMESYLGAGMSPDELFDYVEEKYYAAWDRIFEISEEYPLALVTYSSADSKYSDDPEEILSALEELTKEEFPDVGDINWIISYLDERQEVESVTAYYMSPQLDNIGRRVIRVNGSNISDSVSLFTTLAHEGAPGHLYQDEFNLRSDNFQEITSALTYLGYQEGWAMYVEKLAFLWCLDDEINAELRNLDNILSFMMISLADIGVNYLEWSYDDLKVWMADQGFSDRATLNYVYDMVISDPALYPAYGIGYLLMEDTVNELVDSGCTEKEAYEKILEIGASPYTILWNHLGIQPID
ncbi:MAG: DUF885 family protein [Lachnospiraceae bacterium]